MHRKRNTHIYTFILATVKAYLQGVLEESIVRDILIGAELEFFELEEYRAHKFPKFCRKVERFETIDRSFKSIYHDIGIVIENVKMRIKPKS